MKKACSWGIAGAVLAAGSARGQWVVFHEDFDDRPLGIVTFWPTVVDQVAGNVVLVIAAPPPAGNRVLVVDSAAGALAACTMGAELGVTSGTYVLTWVSKIAALAPAAPPHDPASLGMNLVGLLDGTFTDDLFGVGYDDGGQLRIVDAAGSRRVGSYTPGVMDDFSLRFNLTADTYTLRVNGAVTATGALLSPGAAFLNAYARSNGREQITNRPAMFVDDVMLIYECAGADPRITEQPQDAAVCIAEPTVEFHLTVGGPAPATYQWRRYGTALSNGPTGTGSSVSGVRSETFRITGVGSADVGLYDCVVTTACGSRDSRDASLTLCLADFDCDGFVTGNDFDQYVRDFERGRARADLDGDGFVTGLDFDLFVVEFESGC